MQFQDYYKTLEVDRKAPAADIKKSYRRLSKKYHPDHNQDPKAEERFKKINEAYQVVGDEEKRRRYDNIGSGYAHGQDFRPPSGGWQGVEFDFDSAFGGAGRGARRGGGGSGVPGSGFSDFFDMLFGGQPGSAQGFPGGANPFGQQGRPRGKKGDNQETELTISLDDAYRGATRQVTLQFTATGPDGGRRTETKTFDVKVPPGTTDGKKIRLKGQGSRGHGGGASGDLLLKVNIAPHPTFTVDGHDLHATLRLAPWEAALGAKVDVETMDGSVRLTIPAGTSSGKKLRLRGKGLPLLGSKGLPKKGTERGDMHITCAIAMPKAPSSEMRALFEQMQALNEFSPRE